MKVRATIESKSYYWGLTGWVAEPENAAELSRSEARKRLRITAANNRFLDPCDQVEAYIEESN